MLKMVIPEADKEGLYNEAHAGTSGGHLRGAKIHS